MQMSRSAPIPEQRHQRGDFDTLLLDPPYTHAAHHSALSPEESESVPDVPGDDASAQ
jgi:hypothetical protein